MMNEYLQGVLLEYIPNKLIKDCSKAIENAKAECNCKSADEVNKRSERKIGYWSARAGEVVDCVSSSGTISKEEEIEAKIQINKIQYSAYRYIMLNYDSKITFEQFMTCCCVAVE